MESFLVWIVPFLLVFGTIVFFHELGHFLVAKWVGIKVHEFSIGFGKALWQRKIGETLYSVRFLFLGGFVKMAGMDPALEPEEEVAPDDHRSFHNKPLAHRMATIAAGPAMNLILAVILLAGFHAFAAFPLAVGAVIPGDAADRGGLRVGDQIVTVQGEPVKGFEEFTRALQRHPEREVVIGVVRNGQPRDIRITTRRDPDTGRVMIGVAFEHSMFSGKERLPLGQAFQAAVGDTARFSWGLLAWLGRIVTGGTPAEEVRDSVAGPIGIAVAVGELAQRGLAYLVWFAAFLNVNLALINLLPIPVLDGGWLVFLGLEGIRGKPLAPEQRGMAQFVGLTLLLMVVLAVTYLDLQRLFTN